jgi:NMD protein affecting ribosome stability and mRNA decay
MKACKQCGRRVEEKDLDAGLCIDCRIRLVFGTGGRR